MQTSAVNIKGQVGAQNPNGNDAFRNLDLNSFLSMMIAELQNQDPMNPLDNAQLLQQVSQIREIESNLRLVSTLENMGRSQSLTVAAGLINKTIRGLTESGDAVEGRVDRVSVDKNDVYLYVGDRKVPSKNVSEVLAQQSDATLAEMLGL
ncbi:MAG: flagellar hook capping FlgD N-terminal domain-containing protein [Thermogutta sp.]